MFLPQVNGIKGFSLVLAMQHHSIIPGYVIDYMHGALLGVTKTMLMLWFSASKDTKGKDFFIADKVCQGSSSSENINFYIIYFSDVS